MNTNLENYEEIGLENGVWMVRGKGDFWALAMATSKFIGNHKSLKVLSNTIVKQPGKEGKKAEFYSMVVTENQQ